MILDRDNPSQHSPDAESAAAETVAPSVEVIAGSEVPDLSSGQVAEDSEVPNVSSGELSEISDTAETRPKTVPAVLGSTNAFDAPEGEEGGFVVELPDFSGPLDLLLALIREEQIDIYDIPVARIAQQFLGRIHHLKLDIAAEYLEMAARLLRIKAQMLLPRPEGNEGWEDPRAELVRRLLEYQQVREVVDVLERLSEERRNRFSRVYVQPPRDLPETETVEEIPLAMSLSELFTAVDRVLRQAKKPIIHDIIPRALDVDGAISAIRAILKLRANARWRDVVDDDAEPWQILSVLLALLELAKRGELRIVQPKPFSAVEFSGDTVSEAA